MYGIYANIWGILMVNVTIYGIHGSYGYRNGFAPKWVRGSSNWPGRSSRLQPASAQTSRYSSPGIHGTCWAKVTGDPSQLRRADGARQIPFQLGCCGRRSNILSMAALVAWKTPVKKHRGWNLLEPVGTMGLMSWVCWAFYKATLKVLRSAGQEFKVFAHFLLMRRPSRSVEIFSRTLR